jgi:Leucine-rich repeat (LRR) protein
MPSDIPRTDASVRARSLESLRKEAKQWLKALLAHDAGAIARYDGALGAGSFAKAGVPTLRDVQHALARELGASGWSALRATLATEPAHDGHTRYDIMAMALLDAFRTGTPEAMQRHWQLTWHRRNWEAMRRYVLADLGRPHDTDITPDDARWLVAREHGFDDWPSLMREMRESADDEQVTAKPVSVMTAADDARHRSRDWHTVLEALEDGQATGIDANGQMTDALLRTLTRFPQLTTLRLGGSQRLTSDGLSALAAFPALRTLDLSGTAITDDGLEVLAALPALEQLSLSGTAVTDAGVRHLARTDTLEQVNLMFTACGDGALRVLAGKSRLARLHSGNAVTATGIGALQEYPAFRHWQGGAEEMALLSYEASPTYLSLRGHFGDAGLAALRGLDGLFALNVDDRAMRFTAAGVDALAALPRLAWLALDADDHTMPSIARLPVLRFLGVQDTETSDDGWAALGQSQSIERIWGRRCYGLGARGFSALSTMPRLSGLSVSCRNVPDATLARLPMFPALRELMPMDIPDEGYRHIAHCTALESLVLMYCRDTTDRATEHLTVLPKLARYFASYTQITDRTPALLATMPSLEEVTFDSCAGVTNAGIATLAALPQLKTLRVSGRGITREVAAHFGPQVAVHVST